MAELTRDMVGDLFHPSHVALLRAARAFGDELVVRAPDLAGGSHATPTVREDGALLLRETYGLPTSRGE